MIDPRATTRSPRPIVEDPVELGLLLEGPEPPLALAASEVERIVGWPLSPHPDDPRSFLVQPGFAGARSFHRERYLEYCRDDGRLLRYEYEGNFAYALASTGEDNDE